MGPENPIRVYRVLLQLKVVGGEIYSASFRQLLWSGLNAVQDLVQHRQIYVRADKVC